MRDGPSDEDVAGTLEWSCRISSSLAGTALVDDIPVLAGTYQTAVGSGVPDGLQFTVPRFSPVDGRRFDWLPGTASNHPLASNGQRLNVSLTPRLLSSGMDFDIPLGVFPITDWADGDGYVQITAKGIMQVIQDARFETTVAPRAGGTLFSEFRRLTPAGIPVFIDPALTDRACPQSFDWSDDRLGALYDIANALPARLRTTTEGGIALLAPLPDSATPVVTLTQGERGVVVSAPRKGSREGIYNVLVARSTATDSPSAASAVAVARQLTGRYAVSTYGEVVGKFGSPLLATQAQAQSAADAQLAAALRQAMVLPVTLAADPRIELDDAVDVHHDIDGFGVPQVRQRGYVTSAAIPLTATSGDMTVEVSVA